MQPREFAQLAYNIHGRETIVCGQFLNLFRPGGAFDQSHPTQIIAIQPEQVERMAERINTTMAQQFEEQAAA